MATVEFTAMEQVTSVTHMGVSPHEDEAYIDPIITGYYVDTGGEVFLKQGVHCIQILPCHLKTIIKQLQRAYKIALEVEAKDA